MSVQTPGIHLVAWAARHARFVSVAALLSAMAAYTLSYLNSRGALVAWLL